MATETLILRPNDSRADGSNYEAYPSVEATEYWTLVSEEIPDEDSTYVKPHLSIVGGANYNFPAIPEQYKNKTPTKIKVYIRGCNKDNTSNEPSFIGIKIIEPNDTNGYSITEIPPRITLSTAYVTDYIEIPEDYKLSFYSILTNEDIQEEIKSNGKGEVTLFRIDGSSSSKQTSDIRITQLYLELEYLDEDPTTSETIYLKQNGSWSAISGDIYKKENGIWVLKDASILQQGLKYKINNV
jgi:hypothetical protein